MRHRVSTRCTGCNRTLHCIFIEALGGCGSPNPAAVLFARAHGDAVSAIRWAAWEHLAYPAREPRHELGIEGGTSFRLALAACGPCLGAVQALGLGALECVLLNE